MSPEPSLFLDLIIVLGAALTVATFFHYLKLPLIAGFIGAGLLIGPSGLNLVQSLPQAHLIAEIGIIFLMFVLGVEFSLNKVREMRTEIFWIGGIQVLATILLGTLVARNLAGMNFSEAVLVSFAVAVSSTAMTLKLLDDNRDFNSPQGKPAVGITLAQDLALIPLILIVPILSQVGSSENFLSGWDGNLLFGFGARGLLIIGALILIGHYIVPSLIDKVMRTRSRELFFYMALFLCMGIAFVVKLSGLTLSIGAFVAGVLISESPYAKQAMSEILPLRDNFLGLFFLSVGMILDLGFVVDHALLVTGAVATVILLKGSIIYWIMRGQKYAHAVSLTTALLMFNLGEFSFVLVEMGRIYSLISDSTHQLLLSVTVITLIITPFLYKIAPKLIKKTEFDRIISGPLQDLEKPSRTEANHAILIGYGVAGQNVGKALKQLGIPYKVVDMNYQTVRARQAEGEEIIFGDATKPDVLHSMDLDTAKLVVLCVTGENMIQGVLIAVRKIRPDIKIIVRSQYLLEARKLPITEQDDVVVAEFETALEILARTLQVYGVSSRQIHEFILSSRTKMMSLQVGLSESIRTGIELPTWEALSAIRPVRIEFLPKPETLMSLDIRRSTGASIVAIFREGLGTHLPEPHFEIQQNDVLFAIGKTEALEKLEALFFETQEEASL